MKKVILSIISVAFAANLYAQTVNVHFKNGQQVQFNSANVDYVDFSAKASEPTVTAGTAVDLGLSVYWASCNLGATKPEEYGNFYSWGETNTKTEWYDETHYSYYDINTAQYINIGNEISGTQYDAATVNLGTDWRMPTRSEILELINQCTWEWTQLSGINGYKVIGPNGNSIFLPAAGYKISGHAFKNESLYYWTGSEYSYVTSAIYLRASSISQGAYNFQKSTGLPIRPVTSNPNAGGDNTDHSQDHLVTER